MTLLKKDVKTKKFNFSPRQGLCLAKVELFSADSLDEFSNLDSGGAIAKDGGRRIGGAGSG